MDPYSIAEEWGIERVMWSREWSTLSGGEGQRIALAIAIGIGQAEVVLLDGESSDLDHHGFAALSRITSSYLARSYQVACRCQCPVTLHGRKLIPRTHKRTRRGNDEEGREDLVELVAFTCEWGDSDGTILSSRLN